MNQETIELSIVKGATSGLLSLTDVGVKLAEDTSFEQWQEGLKFIKWAKTKLTIGLADYIAFGKIKFGVEAVEQSLQQLEFELPFVKSAILIESIPVQMRFPNLTGDHYIEIAKAKLEPEQQVHWAKTASEQDLSPSQLRVSIPAGEVIDKAAARALMSGVVTIHGIRQQFDIWLNRVNGIDGIMKMDADVIEEIEGELQAIVELGQAIASRHPDNIEAVI